jgi:Bacitracin resistance protein BacA.
MVLVPILGETFLQGLDMAKDPALLHAGIGFFPMIIGFLSAFLAGCFACKFMINLVNHGKLIYFAIYCAILGAVTIIFSI